jgi:L-cysteine/cystine lyase
MNFADLRDTIGLTKDTVYLNTGFTGPSPRPVLDRIHEMFEREAAAGPASVEGLALTRAATGEAIEALAGMLNASPEECTVTHGTTEGCHVAIYGLPWVEGDEFVSCNLEHPALATPAGVLEQRFHATAKRVEISPTASQGEIIESFAGAITPKTKLVALSHVQYSCGLKLPIKQIAELAHRNGTLILVDGAQTGGQLDLDVKDLDVDFYSISGQKWLLGPNGTGGFYVKKDHARLLQPLFSTHEQADSRGVPGEQSAVRPLMRYRIASQSPALTAGFATAIGVMRDIGLANVEARSSELAQRLKTGIQEIDGCTLTCPMDPSLSCGLVSVAVRGWEPQQIVDTLWQRWRIAIRAVGFPPAVRISCAAFNNEADIDKCIEALATIAKEPAPPPSASSSH